MSARASALFIGLFTLANLLGDVLWPGFDVNLWWISFGHRLPAWFTDALLAISAVTLVSFALRSVYRGNARDSPPSSSLRSRS